MTKQFPIVQDTLTLGRRLKRTKDGERRARTARQIDANIEAMTAAAYRQYLAAGEKA